MSKRSDRPVGFVSSSSSSFKTDFPLVSSAGFFVVSLRERFLLAMSGHLSRLNCAGMKSTHGARPRLPLFSYRTNLVVDFFPTLCVFVKTWSKRGQERGQERPNRHRVCTTVEGMETDQQKCQSLSKRFLSMCWVHCANGLPDSVRVI